MRKPDWVVCAKPPFGGPEAVPATQPLHPPRPHLEHRLVSADAKTIAFRWKDYRIKHRDRRKIMRLATDEYIRRFLLHVLFEPDPEETSVDDPVARQARDRQRPVGGCGARSPTM